MNTSIKKIYSLSFLAALIATTATANTWDRTYDFEFDATQVDLLDFQVRDADINVNGRPDATKVTITVKHTVKGGSQELANEYFDKVAIDCRIEGSTLIGENIHKNISWNLFRDIRHRHTQVTIVGPSTINTRIASSDGNLEIQNITGNLELTSSDGDITGEKLDGQIKLRTSDGSVMMKGSSGSLKAQTSDGDLIIKSFSGSIQAQTSDGDIHAGFNGNPDDSSSFKTSDGDISLMFEASSSLAIEASVSDGSITNQLEGSTVVKRNKRHQKITIGHGSVPIQLRTSDGDIVIRSQ